MRVFFALVGILFDLAMLAVSCAAIFCVFRPGALDGAYSAAAGFLDDRLGRWEVLAGAVALLVLSLRGVFLLLFGKPDRAVGVAGGKGGAITVSRGAFDRAVEALALEAAPGGKLVNCRIRKRGGKLEMAVLLRLNSLDRPLGEFVGGFQASVMSHFRDFLGIEVAKVDVVVDGAVARRKTEVRA